MERFEHDTNSGECCEHCLVLLATLQAESELQKMQMLSDAELKKVWKNISPWSFSKDTMICAHLEMRRRGLL